MAMAIRDIFKISRKTFFNPIAWIDLDALIAYNQAIKDNIKSALNATPPVGKKESFEAAVKRMDVSEKELNNIKLSYLLYALVFLGIGILLVIFSFYLAIVHTAFHAWLIAMAAAALAFAQAFRFHFWYFQIKNRKLGCTFAEWRSGKVNHKGHSS